MRVIYVNEMWNTVWCHLLLRNATYNTHVLHHLMYSRSWELGRRIPPKYVQKIQLIWITNGIIPIFAECNWSGADGQKQKRRQNDGSSSSSSLPLIPMTKKKGVPEQRRILFNDSLLPGKWAKMIFWFCFVIHMNNAQYNVLSDYFRYGSVVLDGMPFSLRIVHQATK